MASRSQSLGAFVKRPLALLAGTITSIGSCQLLIVGVVLAQGIQSSDTRQKQEDAESELMVSQFERSYVTTTDVRGAKPRLIFEGNIAPPFYLISPGRNVALVATPKVILRMFHENSVPVKTPSYMPRVTLYKFFHPEKALRLGTVATYASLTLSHHSNGQSGPFKNSDGSVNHETGNFSTNFVEAAFATGGSLLPRMYGQSRLAVEYHPNGWYDQESNHGYSHLRLHYSATSTEMVANDSARCSRGRCFRDVALSYSVTYLAGDVLPKFHGRGRFPLWVELSTTPTFTPDISLFLNAYWGQDYYNTYFDQNLTAIRFGIQARRGSDHLTAQRNGS
jgi:hypothetical protein